MSELARIFWSIENTFWFKNNKNYNFIQHCIENEVLRAWNDM